MKKNLVRLLSFSTFLMISIVFVSSCRPDPIEDIVVGEAKNEFNLADQIIIGEAITEAIKNPENGFEILDQENYKDIYTHLNTLIRQVINTAMVDRREDFNWEITILKNDDQVNAFITPGGQLFIYTGFLKFLEGEHELVGAIAHEVAYADSDILINRIQNEFGDKSLSKILSNDSERDDIVLQIAEGLKDLVFTRSDIEYADEFCTDIICEFMWDGEGLLSVLRRGNQDARPINWLQTKPADDQRNFRLEDLVKNRIEACGIPDSTFQDRYFDKIVKRLP